MRQFYPGDEKLVFPGPSETLVRGIDDSNLPHVIADEGFHYFFENYIGLDEIIDPDLAELAKAYSTAAKNLRAFIALRTKAA